MEDLKFQSYHWEVYYPKLSGKKNFESQKLEILAWCLTSESKSYVIRIQNFRSYLLLKLPNGFSDEECQNLFNVFSNDYKYFKPVSYILLEKRDLYYDGDNFNNYMELYFDSEISRNKFHRTVNLRVIDIETKSFTAELYEFDIKPVRQMLTKIKIKFCDWFKCDYKNSKVQSLNYYKDENGVEQYENETIELFCDYRTIKKITDSNLIITKPMIFSWDIETYSDNHKKMPNSFYSKHVITMISVITQRMDMIETRRRFLITHLDVNDFEGTDIYRCKDEIDVIYTFFDLINYINPEVILGYNIFLYDFPYVIDRLGIKNKELVNVGRLEKVETTKRDIDWDSAAYGIQKLQYISMSGRVVMDLLTIVSRDYKFRNNKLDTVAKEILGKSKHDISAPQMFQIFEALMKEKNEHNIAEMTRVAKYCIQDSELVIELFEKLNIWVGAVELSSIAGINVFDLFTRGQQCRCLSLIYDITRDSKIALTVRENIIDKLRGALVREPKTGIHDFAITLDFKSMYPSIIIKYNMCFTTLIKEEDLQFYSKDEYHKIDCEVNVEEKEDKKSKKKNDTDEIDLTKETRIVSFNFSRKTKGILPILEETLINERNNVRKKQKEYTKDSVEWLVLEKRQMGLKILGNSIFGFTGTKTGRYRIPEVATSITSKGRELSQVCNDYLIEKYNASIVYGDTDSVMFTVPHVKSNKEAIEFGKKMEKEVSSLFDDPLYMEFEKAGRIFNIKKKKYLYWIIDEQTGELKHKIKFQIEPFNKNILPQNMSWLLDEDNKYKDQTQIIVFENIEYKVSRIVEPILMSKGVDTARRDKCKVQTDIFTLITDQLIKKNPSNVVYDTIFDYVLKMLQRQTPFENYIIAKKIGKKNYKQKNNSMKVFVQSLKTRGIVANPGERIEYVIIRSEEKRVGKKMKLPEHFIEDKDSVDIEYYIEKYICKTIEYLFNISYSHDIQLMDKQFKERQDKIKISRFENCIQKIYESSNKIIQAKIDNVIETYSSIEEIAQKISEIKGLKGKMKLAIKEYNKEILRCSLSSNPINNILKFVEIKKEINNDIISHYFRTHPVLKH